MNALEARLLSESAEGLANTLQRRREMNQQAQANAQRLSLETEMQKTREAQYDSQQQKWAEQLAAQTRIEQANSDANKLRLEKMDKQYDLTAKLKGVETASDQLRQSIGEMGQDVIGGKLQPQDASNYFADAVDSLSPDMKQAILSQNPRFQAVMDGNVDWVAAGKAYQAQSTKGQRPLAVQANLDAANVAESKANDLRAQAQDDPDNADDLNKQADAAMQDATLLRQAATKAGQWPPPKQAAGFTETSTTQHLDPETGKPTDLNSTRTRTPLAAPGAGAPVVPTPVGGTPPASPAAPQTPLPLAPSSPLPSATPSAGAAPSLPVPAAPIPPTGQIAMPNPGHIQALIAHPELAPAFDAKFGPGSAAKVLGAAAPATGGQ